MLEFWNSNVLSLRNKCCAENFKSNGQYSNSNVLSLRNGFCAEKFKSNGTSTVILMLLF